MAEIHLDTPDIPHPPLDLSNIQGDILRGFAKDTETFLFFRITDPAEFRSRLQHIIPLITTAKQCEEIRQKIQAFRHSKEYKPGERLPITELNVAFSARGLEVLGITDDLGDEEFKKGQYADAEDLGDVIKEWDDIYTQTIHGVFLVASNSPSGIEMLIAKVQSSLGDSIETMAKVSGSVRPGDQRSHEHFGFKDGISRPNIIGYTDPIYPGPKPILPGVILLGNVGDVQEINPPVHKERPAWAKDGSFLAFRHLQQLVPEYNRWLLKEATRLFPWIPSKGEVGSAAELLGARTFGRWKSGCPLSHSWHKDDPDIANDPQKNNNFDFGEDSGQTRLPFAAHIRKMMPRSNQPPDRLPFQQIVRAGIPYGPEVDKETEEESTVHDRGLLFVCYQSHLGNRRGFSFIQKLWANDPKFPRIESSVPGLDLICGQKGDLDRTMTGLHQNQQERESIAPRFVVSKGGEYFFSPSLKALREKFATS
ncbi:hypothetical protein BOTBODRAFT_147513 [Botryobasidium botryosum FD-172 SS1]|uniref:DyP dimeric alpha+beta barrel domain-containing protein n=1 Tax=Botryobasidium botryosum (strain FD-172 SS1) TaxID=930990 RepID=A0A067M567_BOTB1|nr:hypothetical protein BOTBODRAFT_147513 [Botryobasidium botryosum FD-172 SS1]